MGSDDQYSFPEFPCVLAYNRVNHYIPTCFLSDESLTNWRAAQIYKHLQAANEFFHECRAVFLERGPLLATEMETLFVAGSEVYHKLRDRAKLGTTAASSVPIVLIGKKPTRSDVIGRWAKFPKKDCRLTGPQPQPEFDNPEDNPALPQYLVHEQKKARQEIIVQGTQTEDVIILDEVPDKPGKSTAAPAAPSRAPPLPSLPISLSLPVHSTPADKPGTGSKSSFGSSQVESSQPVVVRPKRKAVKQSILEEGQVDDEGLDPVYQPDADEEEPEEAEDQPGVSLSQAESISQGIPQLPKKRKVAKEENLKYPCKVCSRKFQRTSELRDHTYVVHLGQTFDCAECLKSYQTKKAYKNHEKLKHQGLGKIKCTQEGCDWADADSGKLHNHLLTAHNIREPIVCNVVLENGKTCGKIFTNTRSFQTHAGFHMEKNISVTSVTDIFLQSLGGRHTFINITPKASLVRTNGSVISVVKCLIRRASSKTTRHCTCSSTTGNYKLRRRLKLPRRQKKKQQKLLIQKHLLQLQMLTAKQSHKPVHLQVKLPLLAPLLQLKFPLLAPLLQLKFPLLAPLLQLKLSPFLALLSS